MVSLHRRFAAFGFVLLTISLVTARADNSPIEIAAIVSLTGPYAHVGFMEARSLDTEVKLANENGGINGRAVSLHLFDDESDTGRAYMLADRVVAAKQAYAIVGGSTTPTCEAIRLATGPKQMVQYCLSGGQAFGSTFFSSFAPPQELFGELPAAFFAKHRLQRVAVIVPNNHAGSVYMHALKPALVSRDLQLISAVSVDGPAEAASATDTILRERPDVIYVGGDLDIETAALRKLKQRRKKTTVWLVDSAGAAQHAAMFKDAFPRGPVYNAADAITFAKQLPPAARQRARLVAYADTFAQYNNGLRANTYSVVTADAVRFIVSGLRANGGLPGLPLAKAIEHMPITAGLYSTYEFGPTRHNGAELAGHVVKLHKDGGVEYIETLDPHVINAEPPVEKTQSEQAPVPSTEDEPISKEEKAQQPALPAQQQGTAPLVQPLATSAPRVQMQQQPTTNTVVPGEVAPGGVAPSSSSGITMPLTTAAPGATSIPVDTQ